MTETRFTEPDNFIWGAFKNSRGANIRYGHIQPKGTAKGTLVILPGFREPIEKYFETIRDILPCGYHIWLMDWRGQGGSTHYLPNHPHRAHSEGYDEHINTLDRFMREVVGTEQKPIVMMAHSMGAHIGLRHLKERRGIFNAAIMTSPMIGIKISMFIPARLIVSVAKALGLLESYVPGGKDWSINYDDFASNDVTSDPVRYSLQTSLYKEKPELQLGDPTYGWLYHTFKSLDILNKKDYLDSVTTPILMQISGNDNIVNKKSSARIAGLLPQCMPVYVNDAKHEILIEIDELRRPWIEKVITFLKTSSQITKDDKDF